MGVDRQLSERPVACIAQSGYNPQGFFLIARHIHSLPTKLYSNNNLDFSLGFLLSTRFRNKSLAQIGKTFGIVECNEFDKERYFFLIPSADPIMLTWRHMSYYIFLVQFYLQTLLIVISTEYGL